MALKKISQETFDETVATNIEDLGMDADEALQSAIEEFEMQGFDLAGIIKGKQATDMHKHEVSLCTKQLEAAVAKQSTADVAAALGAIEELFSVKDQETLQQHIAVALKAQTIPVLVQCVSGLPGTSASKSAEILQIMLQQADTRSAFAEADGPESFMKVLSASDTNAQLQSSLFNTTEAACVMDEENKCRFMDAGLGTTALDLLQQPSTSGRVVVAVCKALRSVTTADDERRPSSKAFPNARLLGQNKSMAVFMALLAKFADEDAEVAAAVLFTLRQLAANDEICKEFADVGGISKSLQLLHRQMDNRAMVTACCAALRQLANSDDVKKAIVEADGLELMLRVMGAYPNGASVLEPALGLLTNLLLRNPDAADQAAQIGAIEVIVDLMGANPQQGAVLRQACMALRNLVVRNPDLRPQVLSKGAEELLRAAKKAHPGCRDVASAALRDLGLDNYQN